jgi:hypothetical protein
MSMMQEKKMAKTFECSTVKVHFPAEQRANAWWGGVFSQKRDKASFHDQDNMSDAMKVRFAADMERWAASRASEPAFSAMCFAATRQAQAMRRECRPRMVK